MLPMLAIGLALCSAFWAVYTVRLLVVTGFLLQTRPGGRGAYIGAVAFPILPLLFGWAARAAGRGGSRR